jgi:hypothetical protein
VHNSGNFEIRFDNVTVSLVVPDGNGEGNGEVPSSTQMVVVP